MLLADGTFGRVLLQTPELVQLQVFDAVRSYPVAAFLDAQPQNLSQQGFAITLSFGIDYRHQALATGEIKRQLADYLLTHIKQGAYGAQLREFSVEFDEAAASALNYFICAAFTGAAAESYFRIRRMLQALAVDACNTHGWVIPFQQMTVHLAGRE